MRTLFSFIILLFLAVTSSAQLTTKPMKKMATPPIVFLDSVETEMNVIQTLNPLDISNIYVVEPVRAKKLLGDKGTDGAIYVTTVRAAKIIYWNYFRTKSDQYRRLLNTPQADTIVQYILNGKPLSDTTAPGALFLITDKNFQSLEIIDKEKIQSDNITPRRYIISITTNGQQEQ